MAQNIFEECIDGIVRNAEERNPKKSNDYYKNGLLYCGDCNTPKECKVNFGKKDTRILPTPCECRKRAIAEEEKRLKELEKKAVIRKLKRDSFMDNKFASCVFSNTEITKENEKQIKIARRYVDKFKELFRKNQGLLFCGSVGTGKSHVACCIGNELMNKLHPVFATSFVKILKKDKGIYRYIDEESLLDKMNQAELVILDDLGAERSTDFALETVYNIIDSRYRAGKPMIVTTNLTLSEMQNETDIRYRRIYDRILEVCFPVMFCGKSWRIKEAAHRYDEISKMLEGN